MVDLLPTGNRIHRLPVGFTGGLLDGIADTVLDCSADLQNAVGAPLVDQPVEIAQVAAQNLNLRQLTSVLTDAAQAKAFAFLRPIVQRDLADDVGEEVAELLIVAAVFCSDLTVQASIDHFVGLGVAGGFAFFFFHSVTIFLSFFWSCFTRASWLPARLRFRPDRAGPLDKDFVFQKRKFSKGPSLPKYPQCRSYARYLDRIFRLPTPRCAGPLSGAPTAPSSSARVLPRCPGKGSGEVSTVGCIHLWRE